MNKEPITEQDYVDAANSLSCKVAAIKAVSEVESSGSGFLSTGELLILFEPHVFFRRLVKLGADPAEILATHPDAADILYQKFKGHAGEKPSQQWDRLRKAANLPYGPAMQAAHEAASYGRFQVLGENHRACGYSSIFELVHDFQEGDKYHLRAFVNLVKDFGLAPALVAEDWAKFARGYNGPAYKQNRYDEKLAVAFKKYSV